MESGSACHLPLDARDSALRAARAPFHAQSEDDGVEVGQQAVGEAAQAVVHVGAGGGDPLGQLARAADGHHRGEGPDVSGGCFEFGATGQDVFEFLLGVVVHTVRVVGAPAGHLADSGRPARGWLVGRRAAKAPEVVADDGVGAGEAALAEFGVELGAAGVTLVSPLAQVRLVGARLRGMFCQPPVASSSQVTARAYRRTAPRGPRRAAGMRCECGVHPFERRPSRRSRSGCYHGHMQNWNDEPRTNDCGGIPCIVRAVHVGDDRLVDLLLKRFARHAEFESPFQLRDALSGGTEAARIPATLGSLCGIDRQATDSTLKFDDHRTWAACRLGAAPGDRRHGGRSMPQALSAARAADRPLTGGPMSLSLSAELVTKAEQGQVSDGELIDCIRTSLPYAWEMVCALVARAEAEGVDFADNQVPPPN